MADISAGLVKSLRDKTGVGMMDCKKALQETGGDMDAATDWLRTKGLSKAAKKADRIAAEGVVAIAVREVGAGMAGAMIELNAETDFVARNTAFQDLARKIATAALDVDGDVEALRAAPFPGGGAVSEAITNLVATIGENMVLRRFTRFSVERGAVGAYIHGAVAGAADLGRMGVMVAVEGEGDRAALQALGRNIALHVAASAPLSVSVDELDPKTVAYERGIFTEQAAASGKPPAVVEKMVEGRLRKFYEESVLLEQAYVRDPDQRIRQLVAATPGAKVAAFARFALGEGVDKQAGDFASEVAALTGA
jgi:elongation factor Ts